jgi:transcriptional regulator NrdR family protein
MLCPNCGEDDNRVVRTCQATDDNTVMRVRLCLRCAFSWTTEEKPRPPKQRPGVAMVSA